MTPIPDLKAAALAATPTEAGGELLECDHCIEKFHALANPATILAVIERLQVAEDAVKDAERLDFVLANDAFMYETPTDVGTTAYQLWNQDEDEDYHVLSGEESFYPTKRAAIDAAVAARRLTP